MGFLLRLLLLCLVIAPAGACAKRTMVALVPDPDGHVGTVTVTSGGTRVVLSEAYQATSVSEADKPPTAPEKISQLRLYGLFGEVLSIGQQQPLHILQQPLHFQLFFRRDLTLTPDSVKILPAVIEAIRASKSEDITVTGYADTMGEVPYNTDLSFDRANMLKDILVAHGVDPTTIVTDGEGEEDPLVPTPDETWEPRNRRVEVIVR